MAGACFVEASADRLMDRPLVGIEEQHAIAQPVGPAIVGLDNQAIDDVGGFALPAATLVAGLAVVLPTMFPSAALGRYWQYSAVRS
jgi:hypothetical protein